MPYLSVNARYGSSCQRSWYGAPMSTVVRLAERRRLATRQEIVVMAQRLFIEYGFDHTTVNSIAAAVGCSPGTFYRYFGSKEDVMFDGLKRDIADLSNALDQGWQRGADEWTALTEVLVDFIDRFDPAKRDFVAERMKLWLREPGLRTRYLRYVTQAEQAVVNSLCRKRKTAPERDDGAQLVSLAAIGAYRAVVTTHGDAQTELGQRLRESLALLGNGLAHLPQA